MEHFLFRVAMQVYIVKLSVDMPKELSTNLVWNLMENKASTLGMQYLWMVPGVLLTVTGQLADW